ncbi:hypothetical protein K1W69_17365 [Hoeflea sp. WL0058]|uniref:Uncharacterized protein n=1 Tax=Flavimaribacter sediminis TaxID=2865987 RepID=A0AAE2ZN38_9HYPH|nr:hypothetical protein [Flavimaribacter sediminis]MBW8638969.1 hypothetical protein [Flavimaribacter sediminis]
MKNRLSDLNNHLFAQLERLSEEGLTSEQIDQEVERAKAIVGVSDQIIGTASLQFKAAELVARHGRGVSDMIPESVAGRRVIEHRKTEETKTAEETEQAEADARRHEREKREEREERLRQEREGADG